jgi:hypothetical protein
MSNPVTCTNHCSRCGRHFHSTRAFDIHLAHDETGWPVCLDPLDLEDRDGKPRLEALTTDGTCEIGSHADEYPPPVEHGVTIWVKAGSREVGQRLRAGA